MFAQCSESGHVLSIAVGPGVQGFIVNPGHMTHVQSYQCSSSICGDYTITHRLNPFAVVVSSLVRNINVQSLVPAPGLHTIRLCPTFVTRSLGWPTRGEAFLRIILSGRELGYLESAFEMRKLIQSWLKCLGPSNVQDMTPPLSGGGDRMRNKSWNHYRYIGALARAYEDHVIALSSPFIHYPARIWMQSPSHYLHALVSIKS